MQQLRHTWDTGKIFASSEVERMCRQPSYKQNGLRNKALGKKIEQSQVENFFPPQREATREGAKRHTPQALRAEPIPLHQLSQGGTAEAEFEGVRHEWHEVNPQRSVVSTHCVQRGAVL